MARAELMERLELALLQRPSIAVTPETLDAHPGNTLQDLLDLGLEKRDLKRLERMGLAIRAYTKNIWYPGEKLPNGKVAEGKWLEVPVVVKEKYVDARGYDRVRRSVVLQKRADCSYRGKGSQCRWLLLRK